jgi:hypothetical protein
MGLSGAVFTLTRREELGFQLRVSRETLLKTCGLNCINADVWRHA